MKRQKKGTQPKGRTDQQIVQIVGGLFNPKQAKIFGNKNKE